MSNLILYNNDYSISMNNSTTGSIIWNSYLGSKTTKTDSGFLLPERVWFIGSGQKGIFKDTLAKAKITAGTFRPDKKVVVVEFDLVTGQRNILMDYIPPEVCDECDQPFPLSRWGNQPDRQIDPLADTQFAGLIVCPTCYEKNLNIVLLRRRR